MWVTQKQQTALLIILYYNKLIVGLKIKINIFPKKLELK